MKYRCTAEMVADLREQGQLMEINHEVDPNLEMALIQRQVFAQKGPAILFNNLKGCQYPAVSNIFGTRKRWQYLFRKTLQQTKLAVHLKADFKNFLAQEAWRFPFKTLSLPLTALSSLPQKISKNKAPVYFKQIKLSELPQIKSWPMDGGPFVTLPQVYSLPPNQNSPFAANVGMYRVQLSGNDYTPDHEVGLHYQIHRGIGIHHTEAIKHNKSLKVCVAVGGSPAASVAAVMPMPEGMSELIFAGMLAGHRFRYVLDQGWLVPADADFCILGEIEGDAQKTEGPFGDHLGYYSLAHSFPVLKVHKVLARKEAIWPFTVVGRPPQEDTSFGELIHEITKPMVGVELPGVKGLHAVDEAGVHPLLLAEGSERYTPYKKSTRPQEILTQASAILGFNQCSLAKYLWINPEKASIDLDDSEKFLQHSLKCLDFSRDLHFHTKTTIDTLDYSGEGLNMGSKVVLASSGVPIRQLGKHLPDWKIKSEIFKNLCLISDGMLAIEGPQFTTHQKAKQEVASLCSLLAQHPNLENYPLLVLADDPQFVSEEFKNFLWVAFTRSNPSHDIYGFQEQIEFKHWQCQEPLIIDARLKPHHAPPLKDEPEVVSHTQQKFPHLFA